MNYTVAGVLDYASAEQQLEHAVPDRGRRPPGDGFATSQCARDLEGVLVKPPDVFEGLLHRRQTAVESGLVAQLNQIQVAQ